MDDSDEYSKLARNQTDPIWIQDHFLETGHNADTRNGTVSFVLFQNRQFAVTCNHVKKDADNPKSVPGASHPTHALCVDRAFLNLSFFSATGLQSILTSPSPQDGTSGIDVAIAELTGSYWNLLAHRKDKTAIDLDNWREPDWQAVTQVYVAGYPNKPKEVNNIEDMQMVSTKMASVIIDLTDPPSAEDRIFHLHNRFEDPHDFYFSGMSGGVAYTIETDGLIPAGIVFEAYPSSELSDLNREENPIFDKHDIFFRAYKLTPVIFKEWLQQANLID